MDLIWPWSKNLSILSMFYSNFPLKIFFIFDATFSFLIFVRGHTHDPIWKFLKNRWPLAYRSKTVQKQIIIIWFVEHTLKVSYEINWPLDALLSILILTFLGTVLVCIQLFRQMRWSLFATRVQIKVFFSFINSMYILGQ